VVKDPETARKLTPDYTIGCKRVLVSDDYFPAFNRSNVHLVTDPIAEITESGMLTASGKTIAVDALIFSTGFIASEVNDVALEYSFIGLNNRNLLQEWKETGPEAYKGISVSGFPNLFLLLGPNTGLGHNSVVHMMESQLNYIFDYVVHAETLKEGKFYDVKPKVQRAYNERIQAELKNTVWASGCKSWYMDSAGRNTTLWPKLTVSYRQETRTMDVENYDIKDYR
jgi:cation diffusion facilitator CzcD-associated flavoprotein CzcO